MIGGSFNSHAYQWSNGLLSGLPEPSNAGYTDVTGISDNGLVVVGYSISSLSNTTVAVKWVGGSLHVLDHLTVGGTYSRADAANYDGSVIVGSSINASNNEQAVKWTSSGVTPLDDMGGTLSQALDVSADGNIAVGYADLGGQAVAVKWTGTTGVALPSLGGSHAFARAISADGQVIVGGSYATGDIEEHATIWAGGSPIDIGIWGQHSYAADTNHDGSIVVGTAFPIAGGSYAFRWTDGTGMQSLNSLLISAGVDMTEINLYSAYAISANGQFIVGGGDFDGYDRGYIVRYCDGGCPTGPVAGVTTAKSVVNSLNDLSDGRAGMMAQQHAFAVPMLGGDKPIDNTSEAGIYASAGSAAAGGYARYATGSGLALLAGVGYGRRITIRHPSTIRSWARWPCATSCRLRVLGSPF